MRLPILPLLLLAAAICTAGCKPGYQRKATSFLAHMQQRVNPAQLQQWAEREIRAAKGREVELTNVPAFVSATPDGPPQMAWVKQGGGPAYVHLYWGGGSAHWGLVVGPPSFTATSDTQNHYVRWAPGIYVWHEIQ